MRKIFILAVLFFATHLQAYPYVSGQCLRTIYSGCVTYPANDMEMAPLDRDLGVFFEFPGGPEITPIEWIDITGGVLNIYDYREDGWAECFGQALTTFRVFHPGLTQYFRTPSGALGAEPGAIQLIGPAYHDPVHRNKRSYFLAHNHFRFQEPWTRDMVIDFMTRLVPCGVRQEDVNRLEQELPTF